MGGAGSAGSTTTVNEARPATPSTGPKPRQRGHRQHRNRDQRVRQIELVVSVVQRVIRFLVLLGKCLQLVLLQGLLLGQSQIALTCRIMSTGSGCRRRELAQFDLGDGGLRHLLPEIARPVEGPEIDPIAHFHVLWRPPFRNVGLTG